ncbi:Kynurenine--oxoglutarate transaminase 1 [Acipenser ruthenus]|uniref:Kynurenine--oxoglutarate transaminase 1 n=1 Tax=Acipenser ruthenus TaxID=7906 RepID=A0A444UVJ3_ACIRT|nr:Kynurenine--oxoglutarate transaminase 1 [Acipenser ruthenus]
MSRQLHARRIEGVEKNIWLEFTQLAADCKAVNLGQGFPDFSPPDFVKKAFVQATGGEDFILHQYTRAFGHPALVKILSRFFGRIMGRQIDPLGNILVTVGAYQALFCTFLALVDEGDKVYKREELQVIADLCVKHGALCISDEVYEWLVYDGAEHVGWAMGPDHLLKHAKTVHQNCVYHCATAAQEAVAHGFQRELDCFGKPESYFLQFPRQLQQKRSRLAQSLLAVGMQPIMPEGGYFLIADISTLKADLQDSSDANQEPYDYRFVKWMIKNKGLATILVSAFYSAEHKKDFENYVRFCFVKVGLKGFKHAHTSGLKILLCSVGIQ